MPDGGRGESPLSEAKRIIEPVIYLVGEWWTAWLYMSVAFLVAAAGVVGLGWWVLRGESKNRRFDAMPPEETAEH